MEPEEDTNWTIPFGTVVEYASSKLTIAGYGIWEDNDPIYICRRASNGDCLYFSTATINANARIFTDE